MHLHADRLCRCGVDLQSPDQNLGLVSCRAYQEVIALGRLLTHNHRRGVSEEHDLRDALLATGMRILNVLQRGLIIVRVDVPDLKLAVHRADEKMVLVNLVEESWVLLVVDRVFNVLATSLDINIDNQNLLGVKARNGKDRG